MTIVRVRVTPGGFDQYGDPIPGTEERATLTGAFTAPRTSGDVGDRGEVGVVVGLTLFAPHGADIIATDSIEIDGTAWSIDGDVATWENPLTGWEAGVTVALTRGTG